MLLSYVYDWLRVLRGQLRNESRGWIRADAHVSARQTCIVRKSRVILAWANPNRECVSRRVALGPIVAQVSAVNVTRVPSRRAALAP